MSKKKKIIISSIAIVLVLAIVGLVLFLMNRGPTLDEILETNRNYFKSLTSLETEIVMDYERVDIYNMRKQDIEYDSKIVIKSHFPSNSSLAKQDIHSIKNGTVTDDTMTLYKVMEKNKVQYYYNEVSQLGDIGWLTNKADEQMVTFAESYDFEFIDKFSNAMTLDRKLVEIDGISCYKVTAKIYKPSYVTNYYKLNHMIGVFRNFFMEDYMIATLYFREDTLIIHRIEYDFTQLLHDVYYLNNIKELESGSFYMNVYFKSFNALDEIIVPNEIKEVAGPYLGNPTSDPIDLNDEYYSISGGLNIAIGTKVSEYSENYDIKYFPLDENSESDIIQPNEYGFLTFIDQKGNEFEISVQNCSEEPMSYLDCYITKVTIKKDLCSDFYNICFGKNISTNSTIEELEEAFGRYTHRNITKSSIEYKWCSYIDYCEIFVKYDKETEKIVEIEVCTWDVLFHLNK